MNYREEKDAANAQKRCYVDGFEKLIARRQAALAEQRCVRTADIFENAEVHRTAFCEMLGWPLTEEKSAERPIVESEVLSREEGYTVCRMRIEILPDLWMAGLLFRQESAGNLPLVIVQHGGRGTP